MLHPPSMREFVGEFVGHYVAVEGPLWRTLGLLVFRPGRLTNAYMAGKRVLYTQPLRRAERMTKGYFSRMPYVIFFMVPVMARRRPRPFAGWRWRSRIC